MNNQNFVIIGGNCKVCQEEFLNGEVLMALGPPFHTLCHKRCYYVFPFNKGWPHDKPFDHYNLYTQFLESKLNLERTNFLRNSGNNVQTTLTRSINSKQSDS